MEDPQNSSDNFKNLSLPILTATNDTVIPIELSHKNLTDGTEIITEGEENPPEEIITEGADISPKLSVDISASPKKRKTPSDMEIEPEPRKLSLSPNRLSPSKLSPRNMQKGIRRLCPSPVPVPPSLSYEARSRHHSESAEGAVALSPSKIQELYSLSADTKIQEPPKTSLTSRMYDLFGETEETEDITAGTFESLNTFQKAFRQFSVELGKTPANDESDQSSTDEASILSPMKEACIMSPPQSGTEDLSPPKRRRRRQGRRPSVETLINPDERLSESEILRLEASTPEKKTPSRKSKKKSKKQRRKSSPEGGIPQDLPRENTKNIVKDADEEAATSASLPVIYSADTKVDESKDFLSDLLNFLKNERTAGESHNNMLTVLVTKDNNLKTMHLKIQSSGTEKATQKTSKSLPKDSKLYSINLNNISQMLEIVKGTYADRMTDIKEAVQDIKHEIAQRNKVIEQIANTVSGGALSDEEGIRAQLPELLKLLATNEPTTESHDVEESENVAVSVAPEDALPAKMPELRRRSSCELDSAGEEIPEDASELIHPVYRERGDSNLDQPKGLYHSLLRAFQDVDSDDFSSLKRSDSDDNLEEGKYSPLPLDEDVVSPEEHFTAEEARSSHSPVPSDSESTTVCEELVLTEDRSNSEEAKLSGLEDVQLKSTGMDLQLEGTVEVDESHSGPSTVLDKPNVEEECGTTDDFETHEVEGSHEHSHSHTSKDISPKEEIHPATSDEHPGLHSSVDVSPEEVSRAMSVKSEAVQQTSEASAYESPQSPDASQVDNDFSYPEPSSSIHEPAHQQKDPDTFISSTQDLEKEHKDESGAEAPLVTISDENSHESDQQAGPSNLDTASSTQENKTEEEYISVSESSEHSESNSSVYPVRQAANKSYKNKNKKKKNKKEKKPPKEDGDKNSKGLPGNSKRGNVPKDDGDKPPEEAASAIESSQRDHILRAAAARIINVIRKRQYEKHYDTLVSTYMYTAYPPNKQGNGADRIKVLHDYISKHDMLKNFWVQCDRDIITDADVRFAEGLIKNDLAEYYSKLLYPGENSFQQALNEAIMIFIAKCIDAVSLQLPDDYVIGESGQAAHTGEMRRPEEASGSSTIRKRGEVGRK